MKLHFQHLRNTTNVGDRSCSPFDYFSWNDATVSDISEADTPDYDIGIYGGGKIFGGMAKYAGVLEPRNRINIAWGVSTIQSFPLSLRYYRAKKLMNLIGTRDYGDKRYQYAPCVSCMYSFFDSPPPPLHDVVFYAHHGKSAGMKLLIPKSIPTETNVCDDLTAALSFIASGNTVVSNSYHGVYWALLMGRKAICIPFSNKFFNYRLPPHYANQNNWLQEIGHGVMHPDMLYLAREATSAFKTKVDEMVDH